MGLSQYNQMYRIDHGHVAPALSASYTLGSQPRFVCLGACSIRTFVSLLPCLRACSPIKTLCPTSNGKGQTALTLL